MSAVSTTGMASGSGSGFSMILTMGYLEILKYLNIEYPENALAVFENIQNFPPRFIFESCSIAEK